MYCIMIPILFLLMLCYLIIRNIIARYKKKNKYSAYENLAIFFPEKTLQARLWILVRCFFHQLLVIIETLKAAEISIDELKRRVTIHDHDCWREMKQSLQDGQNIIYMTAHFGNWELFGLRGAVEISPHNLYSIYQPLHQKFFDNLIFNIRNQYHQHPINTQQLHTVLKQCKALGMLVDQSPVQNENKQWGYFLGRELPMYSGINKLPRLLKAKVFFCYAKRVGFGYYSLHAKQIATPPYLHDSKPVLPIYLNELGKLLKQYPQHYLWSIINKRKYTRKPEEEIFTL